MQALVAVTYRCNARCRMCNTWQHPSDPAEEIQAEHLESLPRLDFANITGGEPFLREDLDEIVAVLDAKADRIVVSTNGYFADRVVSLADRYPHVGFRVSLEGLAETNAEMRGLDDGFERGMETLERLRAAGNEDIGFGITLSDRNADDLMNLYDLAEELDLEFATAAVHNSYYFHKFDNIIEDPEHVAGRLEELAGRLLRTRRPKNWFRAWFNVGLANYVRGGDRLLPCRMGTDVFFVDPFGIVRPCNAMEASMGSLIEQPFEEIWKSEQAQRVREQVASCDERCWMIGSVAPAMKQSIHVPAMWVAKAKLTGSLPAVGGADADRRR